MRYEILVVDDEWQERTAEYKVFEAYFNASAEGCKLSLDILEDPVNLAAALATRRFSAVIVDAKLDGHWKDFPLPKVVSSIGDRIPIVLISSRWDDTITDDVNSAFSKKNCKTFLRWPELAGHVDGGARRVVFELTRLLANSENADLFFALNDSEPIRILHISDLQFGPKIKDDLNSLAFNCAEAITDGWGKRHPHFIVVTGDIAERGLPSEYDKAYDWFAFFLERLKFGPTPSGRLMFVPGNHDYCYPLAASPRIPRHDATNPKLMADWEPSIGELSAYAFRPYVDLVNRLSDCPWPEGAVWSPGQSLSWVEGRFRHLGIIFYGVNTNNPVNPRGFSGRQVLDRDLVWVQREITDLRAKMEKPIFVLGMGHHSPVAKDGRRDDVSNKEDVYALFAPPTRTGCFFNGHVHQSSVTVREEESSKFIISTASTLTLPEDQRPKDTLRGFTLVDLERRNGSVGNIRVRPYHRSQYQFKLQREIRKRVNDQGELDS